MPRGFDTTNNCTAAAPQISAAGYDFVCRYYGSSWKQLTHVEANALTAAGIKIVTVFEGQSTSDAYFSHLQGLDDATSACNAAVKLGQPPGSAIYFAVDYDAQPAAVGGAISDYFQGVADGFAAHSKGAAAMYSVGVYGSGLVCSTISGKGLAALTWLANASAWSGSSTFTTWTIKQDGGATLLGMGVDLDRAQDGYGGF